MAGIQEVRKEGKTIVTLDYTGLREADMIELARSLKNQVLAKNEPFYLITIFDKQTYATPTFMRAIERGTLQILHLIEKQAMVGLTDTKKIILLGYNQFISRNIRNFESVEAAMEFLLDERTTDRK